MRIVAGIWGGRPIRAPGGRQTRPTSEKVREAVFAILGPPAPSTRVLDLYCGSGALGLEALSRGAGAATLVDRAPAAIAVARANAALLGARPEVVTADVTAFLMKSQACWDWIFLDPPYRTDDVAQALAALRPAHLAQAGVVIVEHESRQQMPAGNAFLVKKDTRRYGDTGVSFFRPHVMGAP